MKIKSMFKGTSGDSLLLIIVRLVTLGFGIVMTRILSGHFSMHDYGTYSQVLLITSTVSSFTVLGMMDGINFFFCKEADVKKRQSYVNTIFAMQYLISLIAAIIVMICYIPITKCFYNADLRNMIAFVTIIPVLTNSISLLQIMFLAIGKAKQIAVRNFLVSIFKLFAILISCYVFDNIAIVLIFHVILELFQIIYFYFVLRNNNCPINIFKADKSLVKEILIYCIPMAMFTVIKSINRDCDKFIIALFTDTETLAVYSNGSKVLPFDIIMTSFCTVLLPYITRYISEKKYDVAHTMYKAFIELSYVTTSILAVCAICVAPELMSFLYTDKYLSGTPILIVYTLVDIITVFNITLILSAAGKTKAIMFVSWGAFASNLLLNLALFKYFGIIGPAVATLIVSFVQGMVILSLSAKTINRNVFEMFDVKFLIRFVFELIVGYLLCSILRKALIAVGITGMLNMFVVALLFVGVIGVLNLSRILKLTNIINDCK